MPGYRAVVTFLSLITCGLVPYMNSLQYCDVEALGISCPDEHLCAVQKYGGVKSCDCSSSCARFPDSCCMDAPGAGQGTRKVVCLKFENHFDLGIAVVSSCSGNWNGCMQIKESCENIRPSTDPLNAAPVTSKAHGVTYKNRFCAECNNVDAEHLKAFQLKISCESVDDFRGELELSDLKYSKQKKKWGIYRVDSEGISNFEECQLRYYLPKELKNNVYVCGLKVISKCAPGWSLPEYRELCDEYFATVYDKQRAYRNPHCAICNNKTVSELQCSSKGMITDDDAPLFNLDDVTNLDKKCPFNFLYDPFFKRCRRLQCGLPNYVMKNGRCVPRG